MKGPWVGPFVRVLACALLFVLMEVTPVADIHSCSPTFACRRLMRTHVSWSSRLSFSNKCTVTLRRSPRH